jgi:hypothetical protein
MQIKQFFDDEDHPKKFCGSIFLLNLAHPKTKMKVFSFTAEHSMINALQKLSTIYFHKEYFGQRLCCL